MLIKVVLVAVFLLGVSCAPSEYRIHELPGYDGELPSAWYSGFTKVGLPPPGNPKGEMFVHWVFVESTKNPKEDPVVVWYNGGPGASSMFGLFVELGPLMLNDESLQTAEYQASGIPKLMPNRWAWSTEANLLIVDNPPPVGFSYCTPAGPTGDGYSCGTWNDSYVAKTNHAFVLNWLQQFPEFIKNDLYITGESYAGIYVPTLVDELIKDPGVSNLKGFAVGDGCMGADVLCGYQSVGDYSGPYWSLEFFHGHGQISNRDYERIRRDCPVHNLKHGDLSPHCENLVNKTMENLGGVYGYNLYDSCDGNVALRAEAKAKQHSVKRVSPPYPPFPGPGYPCPGDALQIWLNSTEVRKALNVDPQSYFFSGDNGVGFNYNITEKDVRPIYKNVIQNTNLRVLVYNGDADPGINSFLTQDIYTEYFEREGIKVKEPWRPWTLDGETWMGGYVEEYFGDFAYLTIRGSGHMVPEFKPPEAHAFLKAFLAGGKYLPYKPSSKSHTFKSGKPIL